MLKYSFNIYNNNQKKRGDNILEINEKRTIEYLKTMLLPETL